MGAKLSPDATPLTRDDVANGLLVAWPKDLNPTRQAVRILTAHIDGETNLTKCIRYNVSNIKGNPSDPVRDHTYYRCGEEIPESSVPSDPRVTVVHRYVTRTGARMASVRVMPEHPWSCFRAYGSLTDALEDYLRHMHEYRTRAWAALTTPGPVRETIEAFGRALGQSDIRRDGERIGAFYTAPLQSYLNLIQARYPKVLADVPDDDPIWGDVL